MTHNTTLHPCRGRALTLSACALRRVLVFCACFFLPSYLRLAAQYDNPWENSKYCLMSMLRTEQLTPTGQALRVSTSLRQMCHIWGIAAEYDTVVVARAERGAALGVPHQGIRTREEEEAEESARKKPRVERIDDRDVNVMDLVFDPRGVVKGDNPKTQLINYCTKHGLAKPEYATHEVDKRWFSVCIACDGRYASSGSDPNKRRAEQTAALVCLTANDLSLQRNGAPKQPAVAVSAADMAAPLASDPA